MTAEHSPPTTALLSTLARTLTIKQIAAHLSLERTYVATLLRQRNIIPVPDTIPHDRRPGATNTPETWALIRRDYCAGDPPKLLERRYGINQATIYHRLSSELGSLHRPGREASALRRRQAEEADEVRYRLRTGVLDAVAAELGVDSNRLHAVLEAHGLLLHDMVAEGGNSERH